jgi:ribosomal protein S18 acetylase RimI-like enzyme
MAAPPVFRAVSGPVIRPAHSWAGNGRSQVIQGLFQSRPFSIAAISPDAIQAKSAIQRRPGVDAFQVDLRPRSGGWPLPRDVQAKMEAALGANFSDVRVHVGPEASAIGALAFTWGSDLHFAPGQYNPHTPHGQFLLGHELAHVVQQRAGRVANPFGSGVAVVQDHALEAEADRLGRMASTSRVHDVGTDASTSFASQNSESTSNGVITRKANPTAQYAVRAPQPNGSGWDIQVAVQGTPQPVGSVQLTTSKDGVYISNLKVSPEHRRQGLAGQLIGAALRTARSNGYHAAQLEAQPESPADLTQASLELAYRKLGFCTIGVSKRGIPFMEYRA